MLREFLLRWLHSFCTCAALGLVLAYPALDAAASGPPDTFTLTPVEGR